MSTAADLGVFLFIHYNARVCSPIRKSHAFHIIAPTSFAKLVNRRRQRRVGGMRQHQAAAQHPNARAYRPTPKYAQPYLGSLKTMM